jgi:hypothetical protein
VRTIHNFLIYNGINYTKTFPMKDKNNGFSFKFVIRVGVEESIVSAPIVVTGSWTNTNHPESEVRFKQLILDV